MKIKELIKRCRSYRRFNEKAKIPRKILVELVELSRFSCSAANKQPLKYILSDTPAKNALIFPCLAWAGYLRNWPGPSEGERPAAYIVILGDKHILDNFGCDYGIAAWSILLGATEKGFGGCMIGSIKKDLLRKNLKIKDQYEILLVIALGRPAERVILKDSPPGSSIRYYRDKKDRHIVPKRTLREIIIG